MSLVIVAPETVAAAALDVARIGSSIGAANAAAAGSTTSVLAAGADGQCGGGGVDHQRAGRGRR